jgi:hypothetical protein
LLEDISIKREEIGKRKKIKLLKDISRKRE